MAQGDHLFVWRRCRGIPFQHHAVDVGDGTVVHFTDGEGGVAGPVGDFASFRVCRTPIEMVNRGGRDRIHVTVHRERLPQEESVDRAMQNVGRRGYDLLFDNCEHFAVWCVRGSEESRQVHLACERLGAAGVKVMVSGAMRTAGRIGARHVLRGANPLMLAADAAQWATEALGHHVGFHDPKERRRAGRAVGMATSLSVGALGGPVGMAVAGGMWMAGEVVGEVSRASYESVRRRKLAARPTG